MWQSKNFRKLRTRKGVSNYYWCEKMRSGVNKFFKNDILEDVNVVAED